MGKGFELTFFHRRHIYSKDIYRYMKRYSTSLITGKYKSKPLDITSYLLESLLSKRKKIRDVGEAVDVSVNCCSHYGKQCFSSKS